MRSSSNAKLVPCALLLGALLLTACGDNDETATTSGPAPASTVSSTGTEFYLTLPNNLCVSHPALCNYTPVTNMLIVTAATATTGEVTFNGVTTPFSVDAGGQAVVTLDPAVVLTANETVEAKGIHVTAQSPISVHVVSEHATSADGYLALPTASLGTRYYVMSYTSNSIVGSEFAVVATQNNTTVSIMPAAAGATRPAGVAFTVTLNRGDTYQLANPANADMTGSLVTADKPVALFGAHPCAHVPTGTGYCDYLVEQLPDVSVWGSTHHTMPFSGRARYTVRVMAAEDGTTFTTAPAGLGATLNAGQFADVTLSGIGEFVSSKPVLVAQFMRGYADDTAAKGDPSMVLVTPTAVAPEEKGATDSVFGVHGLAGTSGVLMNIVTETSALADLKLDDVAVDPARFVPISATSIYSAATIRIDPGVHTLRGSVPYSALVYDYGIASNAVSYAYPVGGTLTLPGPEPTPEPTPEPAPEPAPEPVPPPTDCTDRAVPPTGTGHDARDPLHTGQHPHEHAHDRSHDGAHDHAHADHSPAGGNGCQNRS